MRVFTNDNSLIDLGRLYLQWVSPSYLMMGVSQMLLAVMRSIGQTKRSAQIAASCLLCNILLNAAVIYLLFPGNETGALSGVAAATSAARVLEVILCLGAMQRGEGIRFTLQSCIAAEAWLVKDFWKCTLPVQANYLIWGGATAAVAAILGHIGT